MAQHGRNLAAAHTLAHGRGADRLLPRLADNERALIEVCALLSDSPHIRATPAAEWLLDNFHLITQEIRNAKRHLPPGYSRELPRLADGPHAGLPRVYALALHAVSHGDGRLGRSTLARFIESYQSAAPLMLGELWAFPIMLRLALIENLRRVASRVGISRMQRDLAGEWVDRMLDVVERDPNGLILVVADMARSNPPMTASFVSELARRLHGRSAALALPLSWVEQRLGETQETIEQLVHAEGQSQATAQVSVSNSIGSLRLLEAMDWRDFVETLSQVEQILRQDPAGVHARMDFTSRDHYRHVVEDIAHRSASSESDVAHQAVALARAAAADNPAHQHVGHYLIGAGQAALEQACHTRQGPWLALRRRLARWPVGWYALAILATTAVLTAIPWLLVTRAHALPFVDVPDGPWRWPAGLAVLLLLGLSASQLAVALVNAALGQLTRPTALPRMDFSMGIPTEARTLVVVPTMLGSPAGITALVDALEVRYLANRDAQLLFALLTDFHDAASATSPSDAAHLAQASALIAALNHKYGTAGLEVGSRFLLLHRPRLWNAAEGVWMGHERKRGKLADLNALLRGRGDCRFARIVGNTAGLAGVRYVITLDTDTQLPRDAAAQLVGAMAHPLNRPVVAGPPGAQRVVAGHGILQPRVAVNLATANRSRYGRLLGGEPGIDPYTRAVSDVYQDLFDEGSFIGKGIYDVDAFEQVLGGRLPENRILSHDLLEGGYARSGLLSDVVLIEDAPTRYDADQRRRHRWTRGDWQLLAWLLPRLRLPKAAADADADAAGRALRYRNPLSALTRAKIVDNLRRSLAPPALLALLLLGWAVLLQPQLWTAVVLCVLFLPPLLGLVIAALRCPESMRLSLHLRSLLPSAQRQLGQALLSLATLPDEAVRNLDAVLRSLWRMLVSRRRLLEWQASADVPVAAQTSWTAELASTGARMATGPVLALACAAGLAAQRPVALLAALPVLLLWLVAPVWVVWLDRPLQRRQTSLSAAQAADLRLLARRTWGFFETFVGPADHHLPPDNMQEQPVERIAHRTSPTNIGLALLANLAATDFGYLATGGLIARCSATLDTLDRLQRHQGHWLNWYDTQSLEPLRPAYVSTVDSGNLAGHLLTLRAGLLLLAANTPAPAQRLACLLHGLHDSVRLVQLAGGAGPLDATSARLAATLQALQALAPQSPAELWAAFQTMQAGAQTLLAAVSAQQADAPGSATPPADALRWARALLAQCQAALAELQRLAPQAPVSAMAPWDALALDNDCQALRQLAQRAGAMAEMDYGFLYDSSRHLLAIGYNVDEHRRDTGHYDLLASEARLTSFVAIAQGKLPQETWFALGRQLTVHDGKPVLLSWSGSMFEYLMPMLVMPCEEHTLLDQTVRGAVARQMAYGRQRAVPWGISESGYHATDAQLNYQYRAFGVPGLGLKRGLADDLVVAPYASVMALMVDPRAAALNLQRLVADGLGGQHGLYEAIDYTPARLPRGEKSAIVRSYMAHHQGMSLLALAHVLLGQPMQRRFLADPELQATLPLLHERVPRAVLPQESLPERAEFRDGQPGAETPPRVFSTPETASPEVQLLSNGRYHVMLTHTGAGYSRWKDLALSRWQEDGTCDAWGSFCYLRDTETGTFWSTTHQPTLWKADHCEAVFSEGRAEFRRRDQGIDAYTEVVVSPEDDVELRRLRLGNRSRVRRSIELTTYTELVLAPPAADAQHPAFGKLFVQTEGLADPALILCTRRARSSDERPPWMFHLVAVHGAAAGPASHETDRARFIGRGRGLHAPAAMRPGATLSGSQGSVLDPVAATRRVITLEPGQTATIDIVYGAADSREACLALAHKHVDRRLADRVLELAWTHSQVILRQLNATEADAQIYARLANSVVYSQPTLRADAATLLRNRRSQSGLWGYAISGDLPIVLLQVSQAANIELVRQLVQAHAWWRLKGLAVDLVIWNEERDVYRQRLQEQILGFIAGSIESHVVDRPGGIFVRHAEQIAVEDRVLLLAVARAVVSDRRGLLAEQVGLAPPPLPRRPPALVPSRTAEPTVQPMMVPQPTPPPGQGLQFYNGSGGFSADGREYVIDSSAGQRPPAPWVNVIANPRFGTLVSEAGSSYTWCENAHELRLSPWHNDAVCDGGGEVIYLRDEDTGQVWQPTALPAQDEVDGARAAGKFRCRHGFGYSAFEHEAFGIHSTLTVFVAMDAAVKFSQLVLHNRSERHRRVSATGYVEWVLGDLRAKTAPHIHTQRNPDHGALCASNHYSNDFGDWVAFYDVGNADRGTTSFSCDRSEFIGRNGALRQPAALRRQQLSGRSGAGLDPCAAIMLPITLAPGERREVTFRLGMGRSMDETNQLVARFASAVSVRSALANVHEHWQHTLGQLQLKTPDPAMDLLANGWLVYQTLACRLWARSGFYQSGGAFGFRDQLQDAMALVHTRPALLREQLLLCATRQFVDGDVQHWWHPPAGRGVRTHISDDYLWLPLALARYVQSTHDTGVLDAQLHFLEGPTVPAGQESSYDLPSRSTSTASLYQHAQRAVLHGLRFGAHGLPLMGGGDWNDGMNQVGHLGQGESIWLGFFLCEVLRDFGALAQRCGDLDFAQRCAGERATLAARLEAAGWDGDWYRRAYFDDGTPLGSQQNSECRIDAVAQSWAVLSGVASAGRARQAMGAVASALVRPEAGLVQLLDPPFDRRGSNPGYIAGYVPGVRENGGQYTHSAVWAAMAFARLGDAAHAWQVMDIINPIHHGRTAAEVAVYKVEPYVVAADVYSVAPHTGRGGWSWYTGSAGWMLRLVVESLLGLTLQVDANGARLLIQPCVPAGWMRWQVDYRFGSTAHGIDFEIDPLADTLHIEIDGEPQPGSALLLIDDGVARAVRVRLPRRSA